MSSPPVSTAPRDRGFTGPDSLHIDPAATAERIQSAIAEQVQATLKRRGVVVGISGGVDSAVVAALATRALGPKRVLGLLMPERDGSPDALRLGLEVAARLGIAHVIEDVGPMLDAAGCYERQIDAIRSVFSEYGPGYRCKLTLPSLLEDDDRLPISLLTIEAPDGTRRSSRMPPDAYRQLVAATSFKQRVRKMMEYYHADRLAFAVAGTPNRLEFDQGFFVKQGDGNADLKPIAHLYKTQVYELASHLDVPEEIRTRPPTTDTFSLAQTQEEFYFAVPLNQMDICLFAHNRGIAPAAVADSSGMTETQVARVYRDIESKRRASTYLHMPALLVEPLDRKM
jgi:NAD+ synthase